MTCYYRNISNSDGFAVISIGLSLCGHAYQRIGGQFACHSTVTAVVAYRAAIYGEYSAAK